MPRNGSGIYSRDNGTYQGANVWDTDRDNSVLIESQRHDLHDQDIAAAITASIAADGQTTITADLPMSGFKHTNVAEAAARTQYARASQVQDSTLSYLGTTAGSSTVYTASASPAISAYAAGQRFAFIADETCGASPTLNINAVGAKNLRKGDGSVALVAGDLVLGGLYECVYNGTSLVVLNPHTGFSNALVRFSAPELTIAATTADAADTNAAVLAGGGTGGQDRGGAVAVYGNEHASFAGQALVRAGTGSVVRLTVGASDYVTVGSSSTVLINSNVTFNGDVQGIINRVETGASGAGTVQADAKVIAAHTTIFSTVASGTGARLPQSSVGKTFTLVNLGANTLKVYPYTAGLLNGVASADIPSGENRTYIPITSVDYVTMQGA